MKMQNDEQGVGPTGRDMRGRGVSTISISPSPLVGLLVPAFGWYSLS
jgi:hypothetical protein